MNDNQNEKAANTPMEMEDKTENLGDQIKKAADNIRTKTDEASQGFRRSELGIELLGEDGRFDSEDVKRLTDKAKESKIGKAVLGEDGNFDREDVERIAEGIKKTVGKAKELFQK